MWHVKDLHDLKFCVRMYTNLFNPCERSQVRNTNTITVTLRCNTIHYFNCSTLTRSKNEQSSPWRGTIPRCKWQHDAKSHTNTTASLRDPAGKNASKTTHQTQKRQRNNQPKLWKANSNVTVTATKTVPDNNWHWNAATFALIRKISQKKMEKEN